MITGCSTGGIGAALAEVFQEKGYHVFATARNPSKIPPTLSRSANVTVLTLDVLSSESIAAAVEGVKKETGGTLDILINNSGGIILLPALDTSMEDGKRLFDFNFWAPFAMLQAFAPLLIEAKGCVVNNSSASAYSPMALTSKYLIDISQHSFLINKASIIVRKLLLPWPARRGVMNSSPLEFGPLLSLPVPSRPGPLLNTRETKYLRLRSITASGTSSMVLATAGFKPVLLARGSTQPRLLERSRTAPLG